MQREPTKFNITRQFLEKTKTSLDAFLHQAVPDEQFRFFTFEYNDYAEQKITLLLFDFLPTRVSVTVPDQYDLNMAVEEVKQLNPELLLEEVPPASADKQADARQRQTQELKIVYKSFSVDVTGRLVQ